jgi:hypothetical protein
MRPKDKLVSWFIRNIIMPQHEVMDKPGFLITKITDKHKTVFVREIFVSERFIENLENKIVKKYGKEGERSLYSAGKKFGYTYSSLSCFPTRSQLDKKAFEKSCHLLIQYINCMYARDINEKINYAGKSIEFTFDDFVVCRHNGMGHVLSEGGIAGIWTYLNEDHTIEAVQTECQGRKDKACKVLAAPAEHLRKKGLQPHPKINLVSQKRGDYNKFNEIRNLDYAKNSLQELIDRGFFRYRRGLVKYKDDRYFLAGSSISYVLEEELSKLKGGEDILFSAAFDLGVSIARGERGECSKFISDFLPALGWGGFMLSQVQSNIRVFAECLPWLASYETHKFVILRGMLSGIISEFAKRKVVLGKCASSIYGNSLNIKMSEK